MRRTAGIALILSVTGCQAWKVDNRPVPTVVEQTDGPIAYTMRDLRWVVLRDSRIENDSIVGQRVAGNTFGRGRTALALNGVQSVERRRFSLIRTVALIASTALLPTLYNLAFVEED